MGKIPNRKARWMPPEDLAWLVASTGLDAAHQHFAKLSRMVGTKRAKELSKEAMQIKRMMSPGQENTNFTRRPVPYSGNKALFIVSDEWVKLRKFT